jgi:phosphopantothenoylcysteine decarboxylase / phosphopantothenate---cysteine ligase
LFDITANDCGFGTETNKVTIIDAKGKVDDLPLLPKAEVADKILDRVAAIGEDTVATEKPSNFL